IAARYVSKDSNSVFGRLKLSCTKNDKKKSERFDRALSLSLNFESDWHNAVRKGRLRRRCHHNSNHRE
ncbi:unnamed protein product, partial [Dovyalis caffra]